MIKFLAHKDERPLIGIGLSRGNCENLVAGKPIYIDLKVMMMKLKEIPNLNDGMILIFGGENEIAMQDEMQPLLENIPIHVHNEEN